MFLQDHVIWNCCFVGISLILTLELRRSKTPTCCLVVWYWKLAGSVKKAVEKVPPITIQNMEPTWTNKHTDSIRFIPGSLNFPPVPLGNSWPCTRVGPFLVNVKNPGPMARAQHDFGHYRESYQIVSNRIISVKWQAAFFNFKSPTSMAFFKRPT